MLDTRVDAIFTEMESFVLELASDPGALGPQYFQEIIAECRGYLNRVSLVVSEINRERLSVSSELRQTEALYSLRYDDLIANDDRVKTLANIDDRKSTAGYLLRELKGKINELKDKMHALDSVYKVVSYRNRELHATMTAIKDQRRLMQTEIETGAFYGDERAHKTQQRSPRAPGAGMAFDNDLSAEDIADLLNDPLPAPPSDTPTPEVIENAAPVKVQESVPVAVIAEAAPVESGVVATDETAIRFLESPEEAVAPNVTPSVNPPTAEANDLADVLSMLEGL